MLQWCTRHQKLIYSLCLTVMLWICAGDIVVLADDSLTYVGTLSFLDVSYNRSVSSLNINDGNTTVPVNTVIRNIGSSEYVYNYFRYYHHFSGQFFMDPQYYAYMIVVVPKDGNTISCVQNSESFYMVGTYGELASSTGAMHYFTNGPSYIWYVSNYTDDALQFALVNDYYTLDMVDSYGNSVVNYPSYNISAGFTLEIRGYSKEDYIDEIYQELLDSNKLSQDQIDRLDTLLLQTDDIEVKLDTIISLLEVSGDGVAAEPLPSEGVTNMTDMEAELIPDDTTEYEADLKLDINANANGFIWDTITRFLNSNSKVFAMYITCLSLGIVVLILNRR